MTAPIKFDFSKYRTANNAITEHKKVDFSNSTLCYSCNSAIPDEVMSLPNSKIAEIAENLYDFQKILQHCRACRHLSNGFCTAQRFRPVDDLPRRCEDFSGWTEAERLYFKFLLSLPDGRQFYAVCWPLRSLREMRLQYPNAVAIEPIIEEDDGDENA